MKRLVALVALLGAAACADGGAVPQPTPTAVPAIVDRSLAWTQTELLDDAGRMSLGHVLGAFSSDQHGGELLDLWFRRFGTTAHSERFGPVQMVEDFGQTWGGDASQWPLDALPFKITAVHNRLDLMQRGTAGHCGEFRVSFASTDAIYSPLHLIFLFRQPAADDDRDTSGVHCRGAAYRWAELSGLNDADFYDQATTLFASLVISDNVLLAESVEAVVQPWEWRQWSFDAGELTVNPPMFQTLDVIGLNAAGAQRDSFMNWVEGNAAALNGRTLSIPDEYRAQSARVTESIPRQILDLSGLDADIATAYPELRQNMEIVGCPACHTTNANFLQTREDRTFSDFYTEELDARAVFLDALNAGEQPAVPYGPLQPDPLLPE